MNKWILILSIALLSYKSLPGQVSINDVSGWKYTLSPSALLNIYPGIQMGVEKGISSKINLELEGAYLYPIETDMDLSREGFRAKLGCKYFLSESLSMNFIVFYRLVVHDRVDNFSRFNNPFFENIAYQKSKRLIGPTFGISNHTRLGEKIIFEVGFSAGLGRYKVYNTGIPDDAVQISGTPLFSYEEEGNYSFLIVSLQAKFKFGS